MNVIILTTGISGSSVITGFFTKSGFWAGDDTVFKDNLTGKYETFENKKLVELNDSLFKETGLEFEGKARYEANARDKLNDAYENIDTSKYKKFIAECDAHSPWIWKDPRLFLTIGFWKNCLDRSNTKVVVIHRNSYELWKSLTYKRIIYSYKYLRNSEDRTRQELLDYLEANNFSYLSLEYDQFTKDPGKSISRLNAFMEMEFKKDAWDEIYKKPAAFSRYKRAILAYLIYIKNYNSRIK
jgi:hypothetical protein